MANYTIQSIGELNGLDNATEHQRTNISVGLQTPAGYTQLRFDPHGYDIRNMTINQIEELAKKIFLERINS